jgi:hypothetical protein
MKRLASTLVMHFAFAIFLFLSNPTFAQNEDLRGYPNITLDDVISTTTEESELDQITIRQVEKAVERTFPDLAVDPETADLYKRILTEPAMRGNVRGRLAEEDFLRRSVNVKSGWKRAPNLLDKETDVERNINGVEERGQIKVHNNWKQYYRSMVTDSKAERFFIPDDQYNLVYNDLEERRLGALKGNDAVKAAEYARQQKRLSKLGRSFAELDGSVVKTVKNCTRIGAAAKFAGSVGKTLPFMAMALGILDGSICVYEVAQGKMSVQECIQHVAEVGVAGVSAWGAVTAIGTVGAPVAVVVVFGAATYFVVDYGIGSYIDSFKTAPLTKAEIALLWPKGLDASSN